MTSLSLTVQALETACELNGNYVELLERIVRELKAGHVATVQQEIEATLPALRQVQASVEALTRELTAEVNGG